MINFYEKLLSKQKRWVTLGDLFDENNIINKDFGDFLQIMSPDNNRIFISIFQYKVLVGLAKNNADPNLIIFSPTGLLNSVPTYLDKDDIVVYPVSNRRSICEDYPKIEKRKDFLTRINIIEKNRVVFSDICHLNPQVLKGFKIYCICKSNGKFLRDIDLVEYWNKFEPDDEITIDGDLVPIVYFDED